MGEMRFSYGMIQKRKSRLKNFNFVRYKQYFLMYIVYVKFFLLERMGDSNLMLKKTVFRS